MLKVSMLLALVALVSAGQSGPSPVPAPLGYMLTTNATFLCRGLTNYIPITITNYGQSSIGSMQDTMLSLQNTHGIYSTTLGVGTIPPNTTETFKMPVFVYANASLFIPAQISINYYYYVLYTDSETKNVSFTVHSCQQPISVNVSPKVLTDGITQNITVNITNSGPITLNALSISMAPPSPDAVLLNQQPVEVNSIAPQNSMLINERVFVSRNATASFPANLTVDYYNGTSLSQAYNDTQFLTTGIINITESGLTLSPSVPSPGGIFSISLVLTNTGTSPASAVTAAVVPVKGFVPYGGNSVFVGSIAADSQSPVTLTLTASRSVQNGIYQIPVQIDYLNSLRQNVSQEITVPVQMAAASINATTFIRSSSRLSTGGGLIALVMLIIIVILLILYYRERKRNARHVK